MKKNTRITPKHREDIDKRKEEDFDFALFMFSMLISLGTIAMCFSSWF